MGSKNPINMARTLQSLLSELQSISSQTIYCVQSNAILVLIKEDHTEPWQLPATLWTFISKMSG